MRVNRKSTPKMVAHKSFASDFYRLEREQRSRERRILTVALMALVVVAVLVFKLVSR